MQVGIRMLSSGSVMNAQKQNLKYVEKYDNKKFCHLGVPVFRQ